MDRRRILIIIAFIFFTLLLGGLFYLLFLSSTTPPSPVTQEPVPTEPITGLPQPGPAIPVTPTPVSPFPVTPSPTPVPGPDPSLPQDITTAQGGRVQTEEVITDRLQSVQLAGDGQNVVAFNRYDGKAYRITPDGQSIPLTDQSFLGADTFTWSPTSDKAFIKFLDGSTITYDFEKKRQYTLPAHWQDATFDSTGEQIAFKSLGDDPDNRWLATANPDGTDGRQVEHMGNKAGFFEPTISPTGLIVGTFREGIDSDRQRLYFIGKEKENFKAAIIPGSGLETQWSPTGDRMLFSVYSRSSAYRPELWIMDAAGEAIGGNRRDLSVNTWAHKCTFANQTTLYCAVPAQLDQGAGLLPSITDKGPDHLYRIDLNTGTKTKIAEPQDPHAIEKLIISTNGEMLYFTDATSGRLYKIDL